MCKEKCTLHAKVHIAYNGIISISIPESQPDALDQDAMASLQTAKGWCERGKDEVILGDILLSSEVKSVKFDRAIKEPIEVVLSSKVATVDNPTPGQSDV